MERIYVSGPSITQKEIDYVLDAVTNAWYENAYIFNERFERAFAEYLGVKYAVSLPHCTAAIHLALVALNIGAGDEVIVPDVTWIASSAPVTYVGATPVFADVDEATWCLSADSFAACITPRTKAVIPVNIYGGMPDYDAIRAIADEHSIVIIEDAAESIGSEYRGRKAGSFGDVGVFSFHGSKTLTTGEGGMLVTDQEDVYRRVLVLRDHGRSPGDKAFANSEVAYKYRMSSMQAALGLAQLERVQELIERKREIFNWYTAQLADVDGIVLNSEPEGVLNTYWMVTVVLKSAWGLDKDELQQILKDEFNIDTRPFFRPLSSLTAYEHLKDVASARVRNTISYKISPYGLNLPSGLDMTPEKVEYVCNCLKVILNDYNQG
jgi:perosamine synthetase